MVLISPSRFWRLVAAGRRPYCGLDRTLKGTSPWKSLEQVRSRPRKDPVNSTEDGDAMPHVIVKLWPGKSEQQKRRLAKAITDDVMTALRYGEESVSVAFEEVDADEWGEKVYGPDIVRKADT